MDPERLPKRRKTETLADESTIVVAAPSTSETSIAYQTGSLGRNRKVPTQTTPHEEDGAAAAQAIWEKAKGQSASYRARAKAELNRRRASDKRNGAEQYQSGSKTEEAQRSSGKLKPVKKQRLDPLRNHRESNSSPLKSAQSSPGASKLDFFKQFRSPATGSGDPTSSLKLREKLVSAKNEKGAVTAEGRTDDERAYGQADELALGTPSRTKGNHLRQSVSVGSLAESKSTESSNHKERRTFEDQIRDIEAQARDSAQAEEQETETVKRFSRPVRTKRSTEKGQSAHEVRRKVDSRVSPSKSLDRRKAKDSNLRPSNLVTADTNGAAPRQLGTTPEQRTPSKLSNVTLASNKAGSIETNWQGKNIRLEAAQLRNIQIILMGKTTGHIPTILTNLDEEYAKVSSLLSQTINAGESNSLLLIGARGSGKTSLVNAALREQTSKHADQFHVVRLSGFLQTDDKVALREIWRQLGRDMGVMDEYEGASRNVADTLATLLALLSHPAEIGQEHSHNQVSKSVVFIIDEFDMFTHHPRQTLLYNLFDIAQSRKAPIAVLGLTAKFNVAEQLEKRVKSRFSHRYVHLSLPKTYAAFQDIVRRALVLNAADLPDPSRGQEGNIVVESWGEVVEQLLADEMIDNHLRRIYHTTKLISDVLTSFTIPLATLPTSASLDADAIVEHFRTCLSSCQVQAPDSKLSLLSSLSTLQMALLICAARLNAIHSMDIVNFLLVYEEYKTLASKAKLQATASGMVGSGAGGARLWSKEAAKGAWEDLTEMGLILEDGRGGAGSGRCEVALEEINMSNVDLGSWAKWCREI